MLRQIKTYTRSLVRAVKTKFVMSMATFAVALFPSVAQADDIIFVPPFDDASSNSVTDEYQYNFGSGVIRSFSEINLDSGTIDQKVFTAAHIVGGQCISEIDEIHQEFTVPVSGTYEISFSGTTSGTLHAAGFTFFLGVGQSSFLLVLHGNIGAVNYVEEELFKTDLGWGSFLTDVVLIGSIQALWEGTIPGSGHILDLIGQIGDNVTPVMSWDSDDFTLQFTGDLQEGQPYVWSFYPSVAVGSVALGIADQVAFEDVTIVLQEVRITRVDVPGNQPPITPDTISPSPGTHNISLTPTLEASTFSDPDGDNHASSRWQIAEDEGFSSLVYDSGEVLSCTTFQVSSEVLQDSNTYYWRVRYKDDRNSWSDWSEVTNFHTIIGSSIIGYVKDADNGNGINARLYVCRADDSMVYQWWGSASPSGIFGFSVPPGDYYLLVTAGGYDNEKTYSYDLIRVPDANVISVEPNEICDVGNIYLSDVPDLRGESFSIADSPLHWGEISRTSYSCTNIGTEPSESFKLSFYLSANDMITSYDVFLSEVVVPGLDPNGTYCGFVDLYLPGVPPDDFPSGGVCHIGMIVDPNDEVDESDEFYNANRGFGKDKATLVILSRADLNGDCAVNLEDISILTVDWLSSYSVETATVMSHQKISDDEGDFGGVLENEDLFGGSVASLGDLDGDGVVDIAVGAYGDDDAVNDAGAVWILFLNYDGTVKSYQKITEGISGFTGDLDSGDNFGISVASLGDLNSDNVTDIAIGAYKDDDGGGESGAVWVLFLDSDGTVKSHQKITEGIGDFTGTLEDDDYFGVSLSSLGDFDDDGVTELAVGASGNDDAGSNTGAVWILFLDSDGNVKKHQKITEGIGGFTGDLYNGDSFGGYGLASIGDLDGNGINDIAVGASRDDDGGTDSGAVWVLFLDPNGMAKGHQKISRDEGGFTGGLDDSDTFGDSVASLGDIDGDGVPDIVVGADKHDDGGDERGAVWVLFLNSDGTVKDHQKVSDTEGNFNGDMHDDYYFGRSVASLGDLDGDGITDMVVGAHHDNDGGYRRGAVWVLFLQGYECGRNTDLNNDCEVGYGDFSVLTDAWLDVYSTMAYYNDFEDPCDSLAEWSTDANDITPGTVQHPADRFLGQLYNDTVTLTLDNLPSHTHVTVSFDLFIIRTWDGSGNGGSETWGLSFLNNPTWTTLLSTTFTNYYPDHTQTYPGQYPPEPGCEYPPRTWAIESNTLGYTWPSFPGMDSVYRITFTFEHEDDSLTVRFAASDLLGGISDESWGLDDVEVSVLEFSD